MIAAAGLFRIHFGNDLSRFHSMEPFMAVGEAKIAEATGSDKLRFKLIDFAKWQRENAELKAKMPQPPSGEFLEASELPQWMVVKKDGVDYVLWPAKDGIDLKGELLSRFDHFAAETYRLLAISFAVLLVVLLVIFRRRFFSYVAPISAAIAATAGVLGWLGEPVNFFQLLCFFILTGLGLDYTIFHRGETVSRGTRRIVLYSFLTSLVGFGMLAFTSFQITRSMGVTLGAGLFFAYFFSLPSPKVDAGSGWAERREVVAMEWNVVFMFWFLRTFGRPATKFITFFIMLFSFPFIPRRRDLAIVRRFRLFLNFAYSMVDKSAACAGFGRPPRFEFSGDDEWRQGGAFLLSTHVGCIEVLPFAAVPGSPAPLVHAFQQLSHNSVFTRAFLKHLDPRRVRLHAVEEIGVETAVEMQEAIVRGELVLMAGDRDPAAGGRKGVFRFAKLMESPVYAITCVKVRGDRYLVNAKRLDIASLEADYGEFLAEAATEYPLQHYQF